MPRFRLSRRAFLRGAGGAALALPFLEIMGCAPRARERGLARGARALTADGFPLRFVVVFTPNGTANTLASWRPMGGETDFVLSPILAPLEAHRARLLILDGLSMEASYTGPGEPHQRGMGCALTGRPLLEVDAAEGTRAGFASGISVDQAIADAIGGDTKLRSLELAVQNFGKTVYARLSYLGANQPIPPENDPWAVYQRVFGDLGGDAGTNQQVAARRKVVLDAVMDEFHVLGARLGAADRQKLDEHLTAVRDIEHRLGVGGVIGGACVPPTLGDVLDYREPALFPDVARLQLDLLAMALACDVTRVGSIMFTHALGNLRFPWLGIGDGHHDLSHHGDTDADANLKLTRINSWYAEQFAYLVGRLAAMPEGDGTVLDHTLVFWCNELAKGNNHSRRTMPYVLVGGAGGAFRTGRYLRYYGAEQHNDLFVSFLNAYGIAATTFGDPAFCNGPLAGLTA